MTHYDDECDRFNERLQNIEYIGQVVNYCPNKKLNGFTSFTYPNQSISMNMRTNKYETNFACKFKIMKIFP